MKITFDPAKRAKTLRERGLDFVRCEEVFSGRAFTFEDIRQDYGEPRFVTVGHLDGRMVLVAWTPRDGTRRIISMRKVNDREKKRYLYQLG